jgi:hypothetical protein
MRFNFERKYVNVGNEWDLKSGVGLNFDGKILTDRGKFLPTAGSIQFVKKSCRVKGMNFLLGKGGIGEKMMRVEKKDGI